jgi:NAD+ kinase
MMERIGLVVHGGRAAAVSVADDVRRWAAERAIPCVDVDVWGPPVANPRLSAAKEAARAGNPDLVVTVGGDGTFLRGVRVAVAADAMVLGVDVGRVGFLTEVRTSDLGAALDAVRAGQFGIDARLTLTMRSSRPLAIPPDLRALLREDQGPELPPPEVRPGDPQDAGWGVPLDVTALNDVVFEKLARDRQASLAVYDTGRLFASYSADALIVATSTGSTAYSFSAGGPIVSPHLDALVFTPVAPYMVFNRSLVLAARDQRLAVRVLDRSGPVVVSVDGQLRGLLDPGDWVTVYAAPRRARLVRLAELDFLGRIRDRFRLADSAQALADGSAPAMYSPDEPLPPDLARPGPPDIR